MDTLLEWMSYRGSGGKKSLPEDLCANRSEFSILDSFSILGHAEIDDEGRWKIAPPVLASAASHHKAILCGARTAGLVARLQQACGRIGAAFDRIVQMDAPAIIQVTVRSADDLLVLSEATSIPVQRDAGLTILACLPAVRDWPAEPCGMVRGQVRSVHRFSRSRLAWVDSSLDEAEQVPRGVFRIRRSWDRVTILKSGPDKYARIDPAAGRLSIAAGTRVAGWDSATGALSLPRSLYPPRLIARALVLCSGRLPHVGAVGGTVAFHEVPEPAARLAISIMGLRVA